MAQIRWKIGENAYMTIITDGWNSVNVTDIEFSGSGDCYSNSDYWGDDTSLKYTLDWWYDCNPLGNYGYGGDCSGPSGGLYVEREQGGTVFKYYDYSRLNKITIPASITTIGAYLLCINRHTTTPEYPYGNDGAWPDCNFDIEIKGDVTKIGFQAFDNCTNGNIKFDSDKITRIDYRAFHGNYGQIDMGQCTIATLSKSVFAECHNVVNLNIKEITCLINQGTFTSCYKLETFSKFIHRNEQGIDETILNYILVGIYGDPFWCCQSLKVITVGDHATIESDPSVSYPTTFFCYIAARDTADPFDPSTLPIWPQYWTKWEPPIPPAVANPNSDGLQTTVLKTNNPTYLAIDLNWQGRGTGVDGIWYIAHQGQWLAFNPQEVTDDDCVIMKHQGEYLKYKLVLPTDPTASPVYVKHNNRWMCLANN